MKRLLFLFACLCFQINSFAISYTLFCEAFEKKKTGDSGTVIRRAPHLNPVEIYYDDETREIEVIGQPGIDAEVTVFDENLKIIDYSSTVNAVLSILPTTHGQLLVVVECEEWFVTATFYAE